MCCLEGVPDDRAGHRPAAGDVAADEDRGAPSSLAPGSRSTWVTRFPPRPVQVDWPATRCDRHEAVQVVLTASSALPDSRVYGDKRRGIPLLLDWLAEHPGRTWQQRWLASGADAAGDDWARAPAQWLRDQGRYSQSQLDLMTSSLLIAAGADLVRPSLRWLLTGGRKRKLALNMIRSRDRDGFEKFRLLCDGDPAITPHALSQTLFRVAVMIAAKGGMLADITIGDVLEPWTPNSSCVDRHAAAQPPSECCGSWASSVTACPRCAKSAAAGNVPSRNWWTATRSPAAPSEACSSTTSKSGNPRSTM